MKRAPLTTEQVRAILLSEQTCAEIATAMAVSRSGVNVTKRLKTKKAKRVAAALEREGLTPVVWTAEAPRHRFTPKQVEAIRAEQRTSEDVARDYGCSSSLIRMIRSGRAY